MIVVSDTSAITALIQIGRVELLATLFGTVLIPVAVEHELSVLHPQLPAFIQTRSVTDAETVRRLRLEIDPGEAEAIVLAGETGATALIDERTARAVALREGVTIIGLVGVLVTAKGRGIIPAIRPLLEALEEAAGFRISAKLKADALRSAGE